MGKVIDLTGKRFERLVVLGRAELNRKRIHWRCLCDCGKEVIISGSNLVTGNSKSCGCWHDEVSKKRIIELSFKHGEHKTRLYHIWRGMKYRCKSTESIKRKTYKDRGITVCEEWSDYNVFREWALSNGYADNLTIDRIDNGKGYSPDNCRWATAKEQSDNRRNTIRYYGKTISELESITGIPGYIIRQRVNAGWDIEKAINTPKRDRKKRLQKSA